MHRKIALALGLALALASPCSALTTIFGGNHVFNTAGESTFPIIATSNSGEGIAAVDVYLLMEPSGPLITKIDLINGTVFETNNRGQHVFGGPQFQTPGYQPAYYTITDFGTVPTGVVGWVTVDFTGIAPGVYNLALENPVGPSAAYDMFGVPGIYVNGTVTLVPEPSSILLGLFAAAFGAIALRRRLVARRVALTTGLALALASPCSAAMTLIGGNHVFTNSGESTFPIFATSDSGDEVVGVDLFLVMAPNGPIITKVDLIQGTVFQNNHVGQGDFAAPEYLTPGRTPAYFTATNSGHVPEGVVAWVTVDFTGVEPGVYDLFLSNEELGPSSVYYGLFGRGFFSNGTVTLVPEPSSIVLGLLAAASLGFVTLRRHRLEARHLRETRS